MQEWVDAGPERGAPPVDVVQARKVELARAGVSLRLGDSFLSPEGVAGGVTVELEPDPAWILIPSAASNQDGA